MAPMTEERLEELDEVGRAGHRVAHAVAELVTEVRRLRGELLVIAEEYGLSDWRHTPEYERGWNAAWRRIARHARAALRPEGEP